MRSTYNIHLDVLRFLYILVVSTLSEDKRNEGWSELMFFLLYSLDSKDLPSIPFFLKS